MTGIINAMSVDVEDYFQVSAFEPYIARNDWNQHPLRVEGNTDRILGLFDAYDIHATFFILGCIAERFPALVQRITAGGHEIASHGYSHIKATNQTPDEFQEDISKTRKILEDICGAQVKGFRAASYSITRKNPWAHSIIEKSGYLYSSSVYPVKHDLYGIPDAPRHRFIPENTGILEIPITTYRLLGHNLPCGGGGFFRLYPYALSRFMFKSINTRESRPCIFYFHPWEIDPEQPVQRNLGLKTRFRHYYNLSLMEPRLSRLLTDFSWERMDKLFLRQPER